MTMPIKIGDSLAVLGDSITDPYLWASTSGCLVDMIQDNLNGSITYTNCGFNGANSTQILADHMGSITGITPPATHVITEIGTNDAFFIGPDLATFLSNMTAIWGIIRADNPTVYLAHVSLLCDGEQFPDGLNGFVNNWNNQTAALCASQNVEFIDVRTPQQAYEQAYNVPPPGVASGLLTVEGVHPLLSGKMLMSNAALAHFGFSNQSSWTGSGSAYSGNDSTSHWEGSGSKYPTT